MKQHSTNYFDTFIEVADDCKEAAGRTPALTAGKPTVASLQFERLSQNPYAYTSDDILFQVYAARNNVAPSGHEAARQQFFSKGQACFRASPLTKQYGWGIHCNKEGKAALYGKETETYKRFVADTEIKKVKAMRTSK